jgi:hypothetical protein
MRLLYAANGYSVQLIFQAMDAAGKDGAISHVLSGVNPQGCEVYNFKHPSAQELEHELIVRVHPEILQSEGIPMERDGKHTIWEGRYRSIVDLEMSYPKVTRARKTELEAIRKQLAK